MTGSVRRHGATAAALALGALVLASCAAAEKPEQATVAPQPANPAGSGTTVIGGSNPLMGDTATLRHPGPPSTVLVRANGRSFITVRQYNAWLGTYPVNITSKNQAEARSQALEQMVMFKFLAQRARDAGYEEKIRSSGRMPDERSMVLVFIRDQLTNSNTVTDEQAQEYERLHPERFPTGPGRMPPEMLSIAVKSSIRGEQLEQEIRGWMAESSVTYVKSEAIAARPSPGGPS